MTHMNRSRSRLLLGCGSAALALALAIAPQQAEAQAINANGTVVFGSAEINAITTNVDQIDVFTDTVVIDWVPTEDAGGNALDFLPTGNTAIFQSTTTADFAVLNRILPSTNGNIAVINGSVISQFQNVSGPTVPGGFIAFYSPTGLLIGSTATFDVGALMLTTLNTTDTSFQNFAEFGGNLTLTGVPGSTARIQINPGAQILATPENSFFAVVAADVQMLGSARINGSHAYVAGEVVNLSFSNGLFDISVPVGTAATGQVMTLDGNVGGPSSNGLGDNHMIYALARASQDPISMLFTQNLGFDPAQSAGIVNGEIILSANHNVFGRTVDGGSISDGIDAVFGANSATSDVQADILIQNFTATSSLLAISSHNTDLTAGVLGSSVSGNLLLVGRARASIGSSFGTSLMVSGDVLVSAQDYGVVSSSLQNLDVINAAAGNASIFAGTVSGSSIDIGGNVLVAADAFAGANLSGIAGTAQGGQALIESTGGTLNITGDAKVSAGGFGTSVGNIQTGATVRGGSALFHARQGGQVTLDGSLVVRADAVGAQGSLFSPSSVSDAYGGNAFINVFDGGGSISIGGDAFASASAFGGSSNNAGAGSIGDAGQAIANIDGGGQITITGALLVEADGIGGDNAGGTGGVGLGGRASSAIFSGGTIDIGLDFEARADGGGGGGQTGGDGFGGIAGANAVIGTINIGGSANVRSAGLGGSASYGFGGTGGLGRGGNAFLQANGTLTDAASLSIGGDAIAFAQGEGGNGGNSDGSITAAGRGGDGYGGQFTVPNQADSNFNSGAFLLAGGDNGTLQVGGSGVAFASGFAGRGGNGGSIQPGGRGGDAFGGLAQVGLALLGQNGSVGQGSATFATLFAEAIASGGDGGSSIGDFPSGNGGNATGGNAFLTLRAGTLATDSVELDARAYGGEGANGGTGTGGIAAAVGSLGGSLTTDAFIARASGFGGFGGLDALTPGNGGNGTGGQAELDLSGITVQINGDALIETEGSGGGTGDFTAGNGTGGTARLGVLGTIAGSGTISGNTIISSNGFGGAADNGTGGQAGDGFGGTSSLQAQGGGTVSLTTVQLMANGFGGGGEILGYLAGDGTGGNADITAAGTGSQITIVHNVTRQQFNQQNFGAILSATGVGGLSSFGTGIGGTGRGGTALVLASAGGSVALPATPLTDPDSVGFIRLFARGFGGNSTIVGGAGGTSFGGNVIMDVDGGSLTMGETVLSSFTQAGTGANGALDVTGGNAFAGSRRVSIRNGGTATLNLIGGGAGAQGGTGTGTANGGNAYIGQNLFEIVNASATIVGQTAIFDQSQGGNGRQGGSVFNVNPFTGLRGSLNIVLDNANITFTPDASGVAGIGGDFVTRGGNGVVRGGDAQGPDFNATINQTNLSGGQLRVNPFIEGGDASAIDGIGGNAFGSLVNIAITNSQLTLPGETLFAADALGGAGGANGTGGSGTSGAVDVTITGSTLNLIGDQQGVVGALRLSAVGLGRLGGQFGDGTSNRAVLNLVNSAITATQVQINAQGSAGFLGGFFGGDAIGGEARLSLAGTSAITADLLSLNSSASTGQGGTATGGVSAIDVGTGATATLTVPQVVLSADGQTSANDLGGIAGVTQGGQSRIGASGGSLTITGNAIVNANGTGAIAGSILTGAVARAGQARVFAAQGGSLSIGGNLTVAADAFGSRGSLGNASSVSDAYGGNAFINVFDGGGSISIGGDAFASASAFGGSSNNAGAGSIGDAGQAIANIDGGGQITITGALLVEADGIGGDNAGGTGGVGLGGRASSAIFSGGTIDIGLDFEARADGGGGGGQTGGDGFGGIAGANAVIGTINIGGSANVRSAGLGGSASYGFGGTGGLGRGGNAFLQANGTLTDAASLSIGGDAIAFAQGEGGNGGNSDGSITAAGRGGDGYGGQFTVPNQADSNFNSGAFLLAGGDNGTIRVTGEAVALASGFGGQGGNGGSVLPGGEGGDGFGGLAQVGLALLGQNGSLGEGSANFTLLFAEANGVGGSGGFSIFSFPTGNGGDGTGGRALLQSSAGSVSADMAEMLANGFGGEGARGGNGTGGERSGAVTNTGGTITLNSLFAYAHGSGGAGFGLGGGNGLGGQAFMGFQGGTTLVNGDVIVDATGFGGAAFEGGAGGTGTGGIADLAIFTPSIGSGTITGNAAVVANGIGGDVGTDGSIGGFGIGGRAFIQSQVGGTVRIGSAQVTASGRGGGQDGGNFLITGGNGTGGIVELLSTGAGSQLIIERNVSQLFANELNAGAILASLGLGADTTGGSGIGGTGRGGTATVSAQQGGSLVLPSNPLGDPDTVGEIRMTASGFGGGSSVTGGSGGQASGGEALIEADGANSFISMGSTIFNVFAQAGSSLAPTSNITGGNAFGGQRIIRVLNGGEASLTLVGGNSGGEGGDGSGTGNGGNVFGGSNRVELRSGTLNSRGVLSLEEQSTGGNGARGGDVLALPIAEGGGSNFDATDSTINVTPLNGFAGIAIGGTFRGGDGSSAGGNAFAPEVNFTLTNTDILGGHLQITPLARGGNAASPGGVGGNATAAGVNVVVTDSALGLLDENPIFSNAEGGDGAAQGGTATGGSVRVVLDNSTIAVQALNNALATLRVQSFAVGGDGSQAGDATARTALLELTNAAIRAGELTIESGAGAMSQSAGGIGGTARANTAQVAVQGASLIDATTLGVFSNANTSGAGTAIGGVSSLTVAPGGLTQITTSRLVMVSDGVLSTAAAGNVAGQVDITVASGNVTAGELFASARGNLASGVRSQIVAQGGSFNVTNAMRGRFEGDLLVRTGAGGIIGSAPVAASTTAIQLETRGTLEVLGDGSATGGLGGQSINLNAGRSILLNGNLATANGPITLTANAGGAQPLATPPVSVITMAQGSRINAGTGTVTIRLLDGAGDPQRVNGAITLTNILGGRIDVSNLGTSTGSNISVLAGGVLSASGTGRAIDLASLNGEVINLAGDAGLVLTGGGHYGIFAATPTGSQIGSFANYTRRYNVAAATAYGTLNPGGNFAAFRIAPVLTVTANNATRFYGSADPVFTASFTGFQPGDGVAGISGTPQFTTSAAATSNIGTFTLNAALGSLLSEQGYQFTFNPGLLTITARPITVTANNLSRIYGNANPALTFTVGGQGLANGDQLSGALATTANATTGVGTVAITQGSLAASSNYQLTFVGGLLTITQRLLKVTADDLSKLLGEPDPDLTFVVSGDGLVNGNQLTGVLVRDPGEAISTFAIRQGTLNAGSNYTISFVEGTLTINAPPAPPSINNPSVIDAALQSAVQDPPLTAEEEEERFGMDFPDQPEASLISEDPLLDDPVSSGGDASLYSGGTTPEPRGEEK
jgi:hypothetical protein